MSNVNKELYEFGRFRLDVAERLLSREGERVPLSQKAFETLCVLVRRGNHLVRKDELLSEVWPDAIVEENNLDKNISLLREVLGERAGQGKFIETVRGHGFRFVPEVRQIEEVEDGKRPSKQDVTVGDSILPPPSEPSRLAERLALRESQPTKTTANLGDQKLTGKSPLTNFRSLLVATVVFLVVASVTASRE
jgi:DNA-binding winged helix-turn-helix (wHTH) protein